MISTTLRWIQALVEKTGAWDRNTKQLDVTMLYPNCKELVSLSKSLLGLVDPKQFQTLASTSDPFSVVLTSWLAFHLSSPHDLMNCESWPMIYPEISKEGVSYLPQGFHLYVKNYSILIVQGTLTRPQFSETANLINLIRRSGGTVAAIATLYNQDKITCGDLGIPVIYSLL